MKISRPLLRRIFTVGKDIVQKMQTLWRGEGGQRENWCPFPCYTMSQGCIHSHQYKLFDQNSQFHPGQIIKFSPESKHSRKNYSRTESPVRTLPG